MCVCGTVIIYIIKVHAGRAIPRHLHIIYIYIYLLHISSLSSYFPAGTPYFRYDFLSSRTVFFSFQTESTGIGLVCCVLRILFCICPSHCVSSGRRKMNEKNAKVGVDHNTSLLQADNKRVSISKAAGANEVGVASAFDRLYNALY